MKAYASDLAYIHDAGFTDFARAAAPGLLALLAGRGITDGLVVDLGCGSGVWARALTDAGYDVLGVDISPAMIRLARRRAPRARFRAASLLSTPLPRCAAVTSIGECCNYLFEGRRGRNDLTRLFRRVHRALDAGGVFVLDVAEPGRGAGPPQRRFEGSDWAITVDVTEDRRRRRLTRRITTSRRIGGRRRRGEEVHVLQLYRGVDLAETMHRVGFRARVVRGYGDFRFGKAHAGVVGRKDRAPHG